MMDPETVQTWLAAFVTRNGGASGTVHLRSRSPDGALGDLVLLASCNIPAQVTQLIQTIPLGKGMAGLAWERDAPVSTCNIKTDDSGDVRPGARAVDARAAVALPIHADGVVVGVVGIAFSGERSMSDDELKALAACAERAPRPSP